MKSIVALLGGFLTVGALADSSAHYSIEWPQGWEVAEAPLPASSKGNTFPGGRVTATRYEDGKPAAAMALLYFDVQPDEDHDVDVQFDSMLKTLEQNFGKSGFKVDIDESQGKLAGRPARQAKLTATAPQGVVVQWISAAVSDKVSVTITYSGRQSDFDEYWPTFERTLSSLELR